ncbi:ankyrin repeat-containing domain, PGG domain protein [Artemisia annua]|uniref:Ankyrin repeat-containing domain, PGG domain protein n=1 Tax=Artemisia annua TaxID=35608 RepID=A0A2U1N4Q8_ARTAN|nr:ankyrin repeat-containing domain, PGG domain protein [Artemisia annua]
MTKEDLALENTNYNTALYLAATRGNIKTVKTMMEKNESLRAIPGGGSEQKLPTLMPLYPAALFGNYEVVKYLYEKSNDLCDDDGWKPVTRSWFLEKCVEGDMFDIALKVVVKYPELGNEARILSMMAQKPEAFKEEKSNITERIIKIGFSVIGLKAGPLEKEPKALQLLKIIWNDIAKRPKKEIDDIMRGQREQINGRMAYPSRILFVAAELGNTKFVVELIRQYPDLIWKVNDNNQSIFHIAVKHRHEGPLEKEPKALQLLKIIWNDIAKRPKKEIDDIMRGQREQINGRMAYPSRILFVAAELGNTKFVVELIRQYPDLIWKVNDNNQSIFHIAVKHRHEGIYNLLYEIGSMKDLVTPIKDNDGNNMLHLAAKSTQKKRLEDVSGAALKMQRELLWFKEVESIMPPTYRLKKNKDGLTPRELFTEEHQHLMIKGEEWMKSTASQCMVVATLIATIVFAAAFTVPGGYNQNNGIPMFNQKLTFVVFVVADAISLFLSSASILTFLSILTSRYAERDFVRSLPMKLMLGLSTLFLSITTMMITFGVSFFILYHNEMKWIPISIGVFAIMPVVLYVVLQYHLLIDVIRATYGGKYLFKPMNQVLFYENPRI